ncbi:MAG: hypothetical protein AAF518_28755 [Spirochaetota bacterium]
MEPDNINRAIHLTHIFQLPERKIFTFGDTKFSYFILSYLEDRLVLRKGNLNCFKPTIISSESLMEMFKGFSQDAIEFAQQEYQSAFAKLKGLGYQFKNEFQSEEFYDLALEQLLDNISSQISEDSRKSTAILSCPNDLWNFSLLKVSFDIIAKSAPTNFQDLSERGFLTSDEEKQKQEIEVLFSEAQNNRRYIKELGNKLQKYGLFSEYEERFFQLVN